jgi:hypothetical protein
VKAALRIVLAAVALAGAAVALALAHDVSAYEDTFAAGDARIAADPTAAVDWNPSTLLPGDPAGRLLAVGAAADLRRAVRSFVIADRTGRGFDSGQTKARRAATAQALLETVTLDGSAREASQADDLLGVLAFGRGSSPNGIASPADRAVDAFTAAARLDPSNEDAKANLELTLRAIAPQGTRPGSNSSAGPTGTGRRGAGSGTPGKGY